jgi:hypothetical protein
MSNQFTPDQQWRSFQTYVATYLAGMLHPRDVFTLSRRHSVAPPLVEFRCQADGALRLSVGDLAWSDEPGKSVGVDRGELNAVARQTVELLRGLDGIDTPADLQISGSGPASAVAVLNQGGVMSVGDPDKVHPARVAAQTARMTADIDVEGDVIAAAGREAGSRAFAATRSGSIASIAALRALAGLRSWVDPFSATPRSGYLVGGQHQEIRR